MWSIIFELYVIQLSHAFNQLRAKSWGTYHKPMSLKEMNPQEYKRHEAWEVGLPPLPSAWPWCLQGGASNQRPSPRLPVVWALWFHQRSRDWRSGHNTRARPVLAYQVLRTSIRLIMTDFTHCPRIPGRAYNGANGKKIAVMYRGETWILKFPSDVKSRPNEQSYSNSCFSEHLGSTIYRLLGIPAQETELDCSSSHDGLKQALNSLTPSIMQLDFERLIDSTPFLSPLQRDFYLQYLCKRREILFWSMDSANKRIAKSTLYMYIRLFTTIVIGPHTSRLVL